jgi:NitT/TauT family transport system substrate-binding protein
MIRDARSPHAVGRGPAIASGAALATAFLFAGRRAGAQAATPNVRLVTAPTEGGAVPYYARALGSFREAGLAVDIDVNNSGAAIAAAVAGGTYDIGYANILSLAQAHERGVPLVMLFPASEYDGRSPATVIIVANDSSIRAAKDLDGKSFGIPGVGTLLQLAPMAWVDANGGDAKSVRFVEVAPQLIVQAVQEHRVDAGMISEPSLATSAGKVRIFAPGLDGVATTFITGSWFTTKAWADANAATVKKFVGVLRRTAQWANAHPAEARAIFAKESKLDPDVAARMVRAPYPVAWSLDSIQRQIDIATRYRFLPDRFPAAELIYRL